MLWFFVVLVMVNALVAEGIRYHHPIGIPAARARLEMERRIMESGDDAVNTRIVGGYKADHLHFPWLAGLLIKAGNSSSLCSGSLITSSRVVTAAHCWVDEDEAGIYVDVVLGSDFIYYGGTRIRSYNVATHPGATNFDFELGPVKYPTDVALIFFSYEVAFSSKIKPIALPTAYKKQTFAGYAAFAAGYGDMLVKRKMVFVDHNRYVELEVLPNTECEAPLKHFILCTSAEGNMGPCKGDSGGPLSVKICGEDFLIGIVHGMESSNCESQSHFTRVTKVLDWFALYTDGMIYPFLSNTSISKPK